MERMEKVKSIPFRIGVVWGMYTYMWRLSSKVKCVSSLGDNKMLASKEAPASLGVGSQAMRIPLNRLESWP